MLFFFLAGKWGRSGVEGVCGRGGNNNSRKCWADVMGLIFRTKLDQKMNKLNSTKRCNVVF